MTPLRLRLRQPRKLKKMPRKLRSNAYETKQLLYALPKTDITESVCTGSSAAIAKGRKLPPFTPDCGKCRKDLTRIMRNMEPAFAIDVMGTAFKKTRNKKLVHLSLTKMGTSLLTLFKFSFSA